MELSGCPSRAKSCRFAALIALTLLLCPFVMTTPATAQNVIGEYVYETYGTPTYDYPAARVEKRFNPGLEKAKPQLTWSEAIVFPGATYIAPHFSWLNLPPGDFLVVRSEDNQQRWTYQDQGC